MNENILPQRKDGDLLAGPGDDFRKEIVMNLETKKIIDDLEAEWIASGLASSEMERWIDRKFSEYTKNNATRATLRLNGSGVFL